MRKTLVINSGSSSLKYKLFTMPNFEVDCEGIVDRIGQDAGEITCKSAAGKIVSEEPFTDHEVAIKRLLEILEENKFIENKEVITKVGHRVVQGGEVFTKSTLVGDKELADIYELAKLAPLHNKPNGDGIKIFQEILPHAQNIAVFDTEFHLTMPEESYIYPVPYEWYEKYGVRRYGAHGTSHKYISEQAAEIAGVKLEDMNIINCHLGNGASITAIKGGKSIQTSMGLTPLAGIMMGTRSGDIDPSIFAYVQEQTGMDIKEITNALNKESGMLGISGISSDARDIGDAYEAGNERAILTIKLYGARVVEIIGAYAARLGRVDMITFTGGLGENDDLVRAEILNNLEIFGIKLDPELNKNRSLGDRVITTADSKIEARIISTDEEYQIAKEAEAF